MIQNSIETLFKIKQYHLIRIKIQVIQKYTFHTRTKGWPWQRYLRQFLSFHQRDCSPRRVPSPGMHLGFHFPIYHSIFRQGLFQAEVQQSGVDVGSSSSIKEQDQIENAGNPQELNGDYLNAFNLFRHLRCHQVRTRYQFWLLHRWFGFVNEFFAGCKKTSRIELTEIGESSWILSEPIRMPLSLQVEYVQSWRYYWPTDLQSGTWKIKIELVQPSIVKFMEK